jgi:hypothetical protein
MGREGRFEGVSPPPNTNHAQLLSIRKLRSSGASMPPLFHTHTDRPALPSPPAPRHTWNLHPAVVVVVVVAGDHTGAGGK